MQYTTSADLYLRGDSETWKNWDAKYKQPRTCEDCEFKHGKIYPFIMISRAPEHSGCRCMIYPMRTKAVGTATTEGWNGADAWLWYQKKLPENYITKKQAFSAGWNPRKRNLSSVCPGKVLGDMPYYNYEGKLPSKAGRNWLEADFDYLGIDRGANRIFYSNDGLIFISYDHGNTFYELTE